MPNTVLEALRDHAIHNGQSLCIAETDNETTYGQLWADVQKYAQYIAGLGIEKGKCIGLHSSQSVMHVVCQMAINLAGYVAVPLEKTIALDRIAEIMDSVEAEYIIVPKTLEFDYKQVTYQDLLDFVPNPEAYDFIMPKEKDLSDILFTTGTTGKSKGVMRSYETEYYAGLSTANLMPIEEGDRVLLAYPLNHTGGFSRLNGCIIKGALCIPTDGVVFIKKVFDLVDKYKINVMCLVPSHLQVLFKLAADKLASYDGQIKAISAGSSYFDESSRQKLCNLLPHARCIVTYGATEASGFAYFVFSQYPEKAHCVGTPMDYADIRIVDEEGNVIDDANADKPGFISHGGPKVMMGYWKAPELTAEVIKQGRFVSHDLGYFGQDGFIYLLGRSDDIIITGGNKIAPFEIEDRVMEVEGVAECACVPMPDPLKENVAKVFVVMKEGYPFDSKAIMTHLKNKLESYKLPKTIVELKEMPKTAGTNKINKKLLKTM